MSTPAVSVVIPAFRVAAYIAETLDSVLAQTCQDLEILVVDDGVARCATALRAAVAPVSRSHPLPRAASGRTVEGAQHRHRRRPRRSARLPRRRRPLGADVPVLATRPARPRARRGAGLGRLAALRRRCRRRHADDQLAAFRGLRRGGAAHGRCVVITSTVVARRRAVVEAGGFDETLHRCEDFDLWLRLATARTAALHPGGPRPPAAARREPVGRAGRDAAGADRGAAAVRRADARRRGRARLAERGGCAMRGRESRSPKGIDCSPPATPAAPGRRWRGRASRCPASSSRLRCVCWRWPRRSPSRCTVGGMDRRHTADTCPAWTSHGWPASGCDGRGRGVGSAPAARPPPQRGEGRAGADGGVAAGRGTAIAPPPVARTPTGSGRRRRPRRRPIAADAITCHSGARRSPSCARRRRRPPPRARTRRSSRPAGTRAARSARLRAAAPSATRRPARWSRSP